MTAGDALSPAGDAGARVSGPLNGVRVIAFEHAWAGPYGTMMLADMGADVVKVEPPGLGDHVRAWTRNDLGGLSPHFLSVNRNKRSIVLDLKNEEGLRLARELIAQANVVVENFSPGTMDSLGLGYDAVREIKPDIIFCSVSGFGGTGPYQQRRAYDLLIQAEGGLMSVTGGQDGSVAKVGAPVVDIMAAMVAAFAVVSAVREQEQHGRGRHIDLSMLDVAASVMAFNIFSYGISQEMPRPLGTAHPLLAPYEVFQTRTGPVAVAVLTEAHWATFCRVIERPDLQHRPEFALAPMRVGNREALNHELRPVFAEWDQHELVDTLAAAGLACAQVNNVANLLDHPQLRERNFFTDWKFGEHNLVAPGAPWRMGAEPPPEPDTLPAIRPGMHAESVLQDWCGIGDDGTEQLRESGALG
jgi:crotonobetainyl-CoA:carnitine CoA-transferase CaiB-like acyl-CoA transferase